MIQSIALLASDSSHLPLLTVFKECGAAEKHGLSIELHLVGGARAPKMADRTRLLLAGEIDFVSGVHHETYKMRAGGEKRLKYLAQTQNNWDDRLIVAPKIRALDDLRGKKIVCHAAAPCVLGNLAAVLAECGFNPDEIRIETLASKPGSHREFVDRVAAGEFDAALVDMPFDLYGVNRGLRIMDLPDRPVIHNTTILVSNDYIRENRETVISFLKALIETIHFFKKQPGETMRILKTNLARRYGLDGDEY